LRDRSIVRVGDLCRELGASPATIRRDLLDMERHGRLVRVRGGAMAPDTQAAEPPDFDDKAALAAEEKRAIARAARALVKPSDTLFLDGGSTVLLLARLLEGMPKLTVVTNSLRVASLFAARGPRTILTGGELRRRSQTFVGALSLPLLREVHVDTAFIGTIGLSPRDGMTTTDAREAQTKEQVIAHARRVVLLADSSKVGKISFVNFGRLSAVHTLVTDWRADPATRRALRKAGMDVICARREKKKKG
jgi:DeoR/GlpR family transcriptional regulator of sugar metabolism